MPKPLAVQLYTFRDLTRPGAAGLGLDPETLEAIAEIGYLGVETVDVPGGDPVAARRVLEEAGLEIASAHSWASPDDPAGSSAPRARSPSSVPDDDRVRERVRLGATRSTRSRTGSTRARP